MDVSWMGHSCFRIKGKTGTVVTDPYDPNAVGLKLPKLAADIVTLSHNHSDHANFKAVDGSPYLISGPGEYEIKGISVVGVSAFHDNKNGAERGNNTIYSITLDEVSIAHLGDLGHALSSDQEEELGNIDILLVPVGGIYTIDAQLAAKVTAQLEPKIVIPMHYSFPGLKYELGGVEKYLKEMGAENITPVPKLSTNKQNLPAETQVVVLEKV